jgi:aryl-alcohol dehydrogenase
MKIKAAVLYELSGPFIIEELELDDPRDDEVLVRVAGTGLCNTDLAFRDGSLPAEFPVVLGHEGAGVVEKVGKRVAKVQPGDHVVMTFYYCGRCIQCKKGEPVRCELFMPGVFPGKRFDGTPTITKNGEAINAVFFTQSSFASHALANELNVVKVDKDVPLENLGPLGCGIQTGAGGVLNSLKAEPGSSIAVFGTGSVGMSAILAAVLSGCTTIIAVDIMDERLGKARELGATHTVNSAQSDPIEAINKIKPNGLDYSLDCTGIPAVINKAVNSIRDGGTCGLIGLPGEDNVAHLEIHTLLHRTVYGVTEGDSIPDVFIPKLIELYKAGKFPIDKLITYYKLEDINQAVEDSRSGKALKAILKP